MAQNELAHFAINDLSLGAGIQQGYISGIVPLKASTSAFGFKCQLLV